MSQSKKSPNDLSVEELLAALEPVPIVVDSVDAPEYSPINAIPETPQDIEDPIHLKIFQFLTNFNIKPGPHKVRKKLTYRLYQKWEIGKNIPYQVFNLALSSYLEQYDLQFIHLNVPFNNINNLLVYKPKRPREKSNKSINKVELFLQEQYINNGNTWIKAHYIYLHYKALKYKPRINYNSFLTILKMFLDFKLSNHLYVKIKKEKVLELKGLYKTQERQANRKY